MLNVSMIGSKSIKTCTQQSHSIIPPGIITSRTPKVGSGLRKPGLVSQHWSQLAKCERKRNVTMGLIMTETEGPLSLNSDGIDTDSSTHQHITMLSPDLLCPYLHCISVYFYFPILSHFLRE